MVPFAYSYLQGSLHSGEVSMGDGSRELLPGAYEYRRGADKRVEGVRCEFVFKPHMGTLAPQRAQYYVLSSGPGLSTRTQYRRVPRPHQPLIVGATQSPWRRDGSSV